MIGRVLLVPIAIVGLSAPAFGSRCPLEIKKIDTALASQPTLDASQQQVVKTLRDMGARLHKGGRHGDAIKTLANAKELLARLGIAVD